MQVLCQWKIVMIKCDGQLTGWPTDSYGQLSEWQVITLVSYNPSQLLLWPIVWMATYTLSNYPLCQEYSGQLYGWPTRSWPVIIQPRNVLAAMTVSQKIIESLNISF